MHMKKYILIITLTLLTLHLNAQTQVIAHRGFWNTEGSAQNSIAALIKADSIGCYGSEFDVRMSKDGELVVSHDPFFKGKRISRTSAKKLLKLQLKNGETLPLLSDYLKQGATLNTRLILELKKSGNAKETEAIDQILQMAKEFGVEDRMEYLSFSIHAVKELIEKAPAGTPVFYLNGDLSPQKLKEIGCTGPDYEDAVFHKHPEWIAECHALGMKTNVWTVNKEKEMQYFIDKGIHFITTNDPLLLQKIIKD